MHAIASRVTLQAMPRLRFPARDASAKHWTVPVHDDLILRATAIADRMCASGTWTERNDVLRAALTIGLLGVTGEACRDRRASPRSPSGHPAVIPIAFPFLLVCRARDLAAANGWASAAACVRGAIDVGLRAYERDT